MTNITLQQLKSEYYNTLIQSAMPLLAELVTRYDHNNNKPLPQDQIISMLHDLSDDEALNKLNIIMTDDITISFCDVITNNQLLLASTYSRLQVEMPYNHTLDEAMWRTFVKTLAWTDPKGRDAMLDTSSIIICVSIVSLWILRLEMLQVELINQTPNSYTIRNQ